MTTKLTAERALELLRDGYFNDLDEVIDTGTGERWGFLQFDNPAFAEDNGQPPYLVYEFPPVKR